VAVATAIDNLIGKEESPLANLVGEIQRVDGEFPRFTNRASYRTWHGEPQPTYYYDYTMARLGICRVNF
jgi:hypothetical protein